MELHSPSLTRKLAAPSRCLEWLQLVCKQRRFMHGPFMLLRKALGSGSARRHGRELAQEKLALIKPTAAWKALEVTLYRSRILCTGHWGQELWGGPATPLQAPCEWGGTDPGRSILGALGGLSSPRDF